MQTNYLIDAIVRQTTVLIAQLATAGGIRAPLANIAEQVFVALARELDNQGVSRKVSADMFGMALRTYQRRTQRLSESATERGRSLWEAVYAFLGEQRVVTRAQVLQRFRHDDGVLVRGVLHDLTESGLVFSSGAGAGTAYRVATEDELGELRRAGEAGGLDALLWGAIYRDGPLGAAELLSSGLTQDAVEAALVRLRAEGRIEALPGEGPPRYRSRELFIPHDASGGFEGAVLDHFQALVRTICARLSGDARAVDEGHVGGSTYHLVVWPGHPLEQEVLASLRAFRDKQSELRKRVDTFNRGAGIPPQHHKVVSYAGQCVIEQSEQEQQGESV